MVRLPEYRIRKHYAKLVPAQVRTRYDAMKDMMVEQEYVKFGELVDLEETVRPILQQAGITSMTFVIYYAFARALWKKMMMFTGGTLDVWAQILYEKFKARGLNATVLQDIASALGVTIPKP